MVQTPHVEPEPGSGEGEPVRHGDDDVELSRSPGRRRAIEDAAIGVEMQPRGEGGAPVEGGRKRQWVEIGVGEKASIEGEREQGIFVARLINERPGGDRRMVARQLDDRRCGGAAAESVTHRVIEIDQIACESGGKIEIAISAKRNDAARDIVDRDDMQR